MVFRTSLVALSLLSLAVGCKNEKESSTSSASAARVETPTQEKEQDKAVADPAGDAVVEKFEGGELAWKVGADGAVVVRIRTPDGAARTQETKGTMKVRSGDTEPIAIPLQWDASRGALVGFAPKFGADLWEIGYTVEGEKLPAMVGTLHVPSGGTAALIADAELAKAIVIAPDAKGPHGGAIQVVGDDRMEIVSAEGSGEVRVYLLDANLKVVEAKDREIKLTVVAEGAPKTIVLEAKGGYYVGLWAFKVAPTRVTVCVRKANVVHVAVVGWRPGVVLVVGPAAPRVVIVTKVHGVHWEFDDDVHFKVKGHGHGKGHFKIK